MAINENFSAKSIIRVDIYTPNNEEISPVDKGRINKLFIRFTIDVALLLVGFIITFLTFDIFSLICVLLVLYTTIVTGKAYYSAAAGRGLRTSYLFGISSLTVVNEMSSAEIPYTMFNRVIQREDGLILEITGGALHFLPEEALEESEVKNRLCGFLRKKFKEKYIIHVKSTEQRLKEEALKNAEKQERIDSLGKLITTVSYTVTKADMRAYHRIVLKRSETLRHILISVIGAVATVLPIINAITRQPAWYSMFCVALIILALLFIIPKVGLVFPAKNCFFADREEKLECFVHEGGIAVKCGRRRILSTWQNMDEVIFDEADGIYADMGDRCTVFLPSDLMIKPVEALIIDAYEKAVKENNN